MMLIRCVEILHDFPRIDPADVLTWFLFGVESAEVYQLIFQLEIFDFITVEQQGSSTTLRSAKVMLDRVRKIYPKEESRYKFKTWFVRNVNFESILFKTWSTATSSLTNAQDCTAPHLLRQKYVKKGGTGVRLNSSTRCSLWAEELLQNYKKVGSAQRALIDTNFRFLLSSPNVVQLLICGNICIK